MQLANRLVIYSHKHQERYALLTLAITFGTIWRTSIAPNPISIPAFETHMQLVYMYAY